jgi:hypothetical protein
MELREKKINRAPSTINTYVAASVHASSDFYFFDLLYALIKYSTSPTLGWAGQWIKDGPEEDGSYRLIYLQKAGRWELAVELVLDRLIGPTWIAQERICESVSDRSLHTHTFTYGCVG